MDVVLKNLMLNDLVLEILVNNKNITIEDARLILDLELELQNKVIDKLLHNVMEDIL